jgi:hypothetical protein
VCGGDQFFAGLIGSEAGCQSDDWRHQKNREGRSNPYDADQAIR